MPWVAQLCAFKDANTVTTVGALGTVLVVTRKAMGAALPLNPDALLTAGGGQVAGLGGSAINKILESHSVTQQVGTESGRTSRGTPTLAKQYAALLNELHRNGGLDLERIEKWWVERFVDYFNSEPFRLSYDEGKTLVVALRSVLSQALERQKRSPGKTYVGAVLQHLVGAKLALAMPQIGIEHNGASVADAVSARSGDFVLDDVVIHCTTTPSAELLKKCKLNLESGKRPIILTLAKSIGAAEQAAENLGIEGRVEVMDALQFVAANLYEMSLFKTADRKVVVRALVEKYNDIVAAHESDASLRIDMG
jgi:Domain of unknown function (DUF4928)